MMSRDPQRQILKSNFKNPKPGLHSNYSKPLLNIGFRLAKPFKETLFNKGNVLFAITFGCKITFSPDSTYDFEIRSVTEIIDNKKPLAVWALKMTTDEEIKYFEKAVNDDLKSKGFVSINHLKVSFDDKDIENYIKTELDDFLAEHKQ